MAKAKTMAEYMEWWKNMPADERAKMKHEVTGYFVASEGSEKYAKILDALELVEAEETLANFIVDNMTAPADSNMPQEEKDPEPERRALVVYQAWNEAHSKLGYKNLFEGISEPDFLQMVKSCNFSEIRDKGSNKALKYTLFRISSAIYGKQKRELRAEYMRKCKEQTGINDNDKVENWSRRTDFAGYRAVFPKG